MGRDWSWLGGGKKKSTSKSKKDIKATPPPSSPAGNTATTAAGCMSAVINIFDLQHLHFPINHHHLHLPKGVDVEETPSSPTRKDGNLNISMGIKIKTKPSSSSLAATESYSPSVKTPTLVARLMGLDLVPDNYISSPTPSSSSSSHTNKHRHYSLQRNSVDGGTRSLPETPRISLGRRSVDVISHQHQRSSLHLREMKIHVEDRENRSPRDYARKIVMQIKENVSRRRRMGTDITNREQQAREAHEPKKAPKVRDEPRLQTVKTEPQGTEQDKKQSNSATKRKKAENFKSRLVKPPQTMKEELFVRSPETRNRKDSSNLRETRSSRNRASTTEFTTFRSQSQTQIAPITKRTLVLKDVDEMVAGEFPATATQSELVASEGEGIVTELERGIFEALVAETTAYYYDTWSKPAPFKRNDDVSGTWGVHVTRCHSKVGTHHDSSSLFRERRLRCPRG
ncbi:Uncharacterized protein Rs2_42458 [Raphanus sativus]|uniref:Uncharacterized protein LOC108825862 n=1 Tax=Raphanus sativus TaxID=3726 RepID=A0A6J0L3H3_RAPSA|nr:uncharacterized protein LOC108825862 [Raphanus sativus]KAJ4877440.1 Uncharacterized protein Rs2_42458 [Raphanus sativus]